VLLGFLGGLGRLALAGFVRCRVVDLADVIGFDRKRLVLHAISRVRFGLDLAFNNDRRPGLEGGGELRQWPPNLNLEPIGVLVLGSVLVFPLLVDGNAEVDDIAVEVGRNISALKTPLSAEFLGGNHATAISCLLGSISTLVRNRTLSASNIRIMRSSVMPKYSLRSSRETCDS